MFSDPISELYKNIDDPFKKMEEIRQSEIYKLWEQHNRETQKTPTPSLAERITGINSHSPFSQFAVIAAAGLILIGIILLILDRKRGGGKRKNRKKLTERTTGAITNVTERREGSKTRRYGLVEFTWDGFRYTQGFYLPIREEYDVGKEIVILIDPQDIRNSRPDIPSPADSSALEAAGQWMVIIGIILMFIRCLTP